MAGIHRGVRHESEVLLRQIDGHLATLRAGRAAVADADLAVAERVAAALRRLVAETSRASAVDRARVRAAVHYFVARGARAPVTGRYLAQPVGLGQRSERRTNWSVHDDLRIVNDILRELGVDPIPYPEYPAPTEDAAAS